MKLDGKAFGEPLQTKLDNLTRLQAEARDAVEAREAAQRELKAAEADDMSSAVEARVAGKGTPAHTVSEEAKKTLQAAEYDETAARRARLAGVDAVVDEAKIPSYRERLNAEDAKLSGAAVKALAALESILERIAEVRANRGWLLQPSLGDTLRDPIVDDVWIGADSVRRPNGAPARSRDLTQPIRQALEGADRAPTGQDTSGFPPPGFRLQGPYGAVPTLQEQRLSAASARLFAEQSGDFLVDEDAE